MWIDNWNNSALYYNHSITDKFDDLMQEVNKRLEEIDNLEEWDLNVQKEYSLLNAIRDLYEECQNTEMYDI